MADDQQLVVAEVALGPPSRTGSRVIGSIIGIPIGIGLVVPPHALLLGVGGVAFLGFVVGSIATTTVRIRRFATENNLALGALGRGQLAEARGVFVRWAPSGVPIISAVARHNLGWTLMLEGRLDVAVQILEDAAAHRLRPLTRASLLPTTRIDIALCHALLGDLAAADAWSTRAAQPVKGPSRPAFPGILALVRAIIDCRRGKAAEAVVALEHAWEQNEAMLTGETLRIMRVVRAFAAAAADGPRNQGIVERLLGDMKVRYPHELAFLGGSWPEMATFLAAHRLDG